MSASKFLPALAAVGGLMAMTAFQCPSATPGAACIEAGNRSFVGVAAAARRTLETCLAGASPTAGSLLTCLERDPKGRIAHARSRAEKGEALACEAGAPPAFGWTGSGNTSKAAIASAEALAMGLFGRELDAAQATERAAARCQKRMLVAAGRCSDAWSRSFERCSAAVLRGGADDAFDLVACKEVDASSAVAVACDDGVATEIETACDGFALDALFPGCAGDVGECARGHARKSASDAINVAGALCGDVLPGTLPERELLQCFAPPPPEPILWAGVPLPEGISPYTVTFQPDGAKLIVGFTASDLDGMQLAEVGADGSGFRCLTCGSAMRGNLDPVQLFRDGRRVLVAGPNGVVARWHVLECTPSLLDCQTSALVPVVLPRNPDATAPVLQYRVPWVSLDDGWLVWTEVRLRGPGGNVSAMGRLVRDASRYVVTDARVIAPALPSLEIGTDPALWRNFTQPFEAKYGALRGGRDWVEAGTPTAGQYDTSVIDLATGVMRRLTTHPDHDEGVRFSRDERWAVLQSARTDDRVEFLGALPRPPYLEWIAFSIHFVGIAGAPNDGISPGTDRKERDCYVDPWLLDTWFERGDYIGQRLLKPEDGWVSIEGNAGGFGWSPDGTRIGLIERRWRYEEPGARIQIASLPNRAPVTPDRWVPTVPTPEPTWAVRYEDWRVPNTQGTTVIPGEVSGTATIHNAMPSTTSGEIEVVFDGYSDDGLVVLDGFERMRIPDFVNQGAEYEVDLALSGALTGSMRGAIHYDFVNDVNTGEVVTEVDGRRLSGPRTCYEAGLIPVP